MNTTINSTQGHNKNSLISSCNYSHKVEKENRQDGLLKGSGTNKVSPPRNLYWDMVRFQNKYAPSKTMRLCNRVPIQHGDGVKNPLICKTKGKRAHYGNMTTCKSPYCSTCSDYFRREKRSRLHKGILNAMNSGYSVNMATFTIPRSFGNDDYNKKYKVLNECWGRTINAFKQKLKRLGIKLYTVRGMDVTINAQRRDPIHLHIHALIITDKPPFKDFRDWIWRTYKKHMNKRGVRVVKKAFDIRQVLEDREIHEYIVKTLGTIERELTSTNKDGKDKNSKGWFKWLCSIVENPTRRDIAIYQEFLNTSKNKRTCDLSQNWVDLEELIQKTEPISNEIELRDEKTEDLISRYWVLDLQLWEAIKEIKIEPLVLEIVDSYLDEGKNRESYTLLETIIDLDVTKVYGDHKKRFYCNLLKDMVRCHYNT